MKLTTRPLRCTRGFLGTALAIAGGTALVGFAMNALFGAKEQVGAQKQTIKQVEANEELKTRTTADKNVYLERNVSKKKVLDKEVKKTSNAKERAKAVFNYFDRGRK